MSKERIKSFVLMFLVMMNFVLGAKILTDKKLWPYGYNFFLSLRNSDIVKVITNTSDKKITKTHLTMPEQIIVNTGDQTSRIAVKPNDDIFDEINNAASEIIEDTLKCEEIHFSPKSEWITVLNGQSLCLNYAVVYDTKLLGDFFGVDTNVLSGYVQSLSRIVIAADQSVYFEDYKSGSFYKAETTRNSEKIVSIISKTRSEYKDNNDIINYSVDLKFDEAFGTQKAVLSPTVPVYSTPVNMPYLTAVNPLINEFGEPDRSIIEKILPVFKINVSNVRRYTEVNGTMVFVENNGILKINPNGILYYQSTDSDGFYLTSGDSYVETVGALADFADRVNSAAGAASDLYVSSPLSQYNSAVFFDYRANGIPVNINFGDQKNAIKAEIKNGAVTSYTQVLRKYVTGTEVYDTPAYIEALDAAIEYYSRDMNNIEIEKMYLAYTDNGDILPKSAVWQSKVKSIEINGEDIA